MRIYVYTHKKGPAHPRNRKPCKRRSRDDWLVFRHETLRLIFRHFINYELKLLLKSFPFCCEEHTTYSDGYKWMCDAGWGNRGVGVNLLHCCWRSCCRSHHQHNSILHLHQGRQTRNATLNFLQKCLPVSWFFQICCNPLYISHTPMVIIGPYRKGSLLWKDFFCKPCYPLRGPGKNGISSCATM